jgi:hypothetical protein
LPLILQLFEALLLEPCPARPAVGDLDPTLAADTALALLQVCWVSAVVVLLGVEFVTYSGVHHKW